MERYVLRPQRVFESVSAASPGGHVTVTMERTSTGGTRREAQMIRAECGAMSAAERQEKKRRRHALFPEKEATLRANDVARKARCASPARQMSTLSPVLTSGALAGARAGVLPDLSQHHRCVSSNTIAACRARCARCWQVRCSA